MGIDAEEKLKEFIGEDIEPQHFWEMANRNLQDRKLLLLFVADVVPTELQAGETPHDYFEKWKSIT